MPDRTLLPPARPLPAGVAELRSEVRGFLATERAAETFAPACDAWLSGWDESFSRRLGERGWVGMTIPPELSAVLAAKAQASHCAGIVAAIAHQLHGAIGTTEEHRLRLTTTRLWSWRDEDGSEAECFAELGRAALSAATGAATGAGGLWPWLSGRG